MSILTNDVIMEGTEKKCFVIMPISDTESYNRGHWNDVYNFLIKPAVEKAGYIPERADEIRSANLIAVDIIKRICEYPMAICDLSACNPNVFYELGIRHSMRLPVVLIKDTKTNNPFDIKDIRYIEYDAGLSVAEIPSKQELLSTTLVQTQKDFDRGEGFYNSLFTFLKPKFQSSPKTLLTDLTFLEKQAKFYCDKIEHDMCIDNLKLYNELLAFSRLCFEYERGHIIWDYVKEKYNNSSYAILKFF